MTTNIAPITQLMLTVQFAPPVNPLGPIEIANCFAAFRSDFPVFEQIGRAGPMQPDPAVIELSMPFGSARTKLSAADGSRTILFQEDRFSYGWDRTSSLAGPTDYPGFEQVMGDALVIWDRLKTVLSGETAAHSVPLAAEIAYVDAFANYDSSGTQIRLSSMFNLLNPEYQVPVSGYGFTWNETLDGMIGFLQLQITGPAMSPDGVVTQFQTTGRFKPQAGWTGIADEFRKVHGSIDQAFKKLVNPALRPN